MMNQREMSEKKASRGIAPLLPVCASRTFSMLSMPSVMPGKYAAQRHATPDLQQRLPPHHLQLTSSTVLCMPCLTTVL